MKKNIVSFSHIDKILFPKIAVTKQEVLNYYAKIAPLFLKYNSERLIVMQRFPHGIDQDNFYQKQISDYFPTWLSHKTIQLKKGGKQTLIFLKKLEDILYLANQGVLVFHSWLSSVNAIKKPDKIVFDLDPDIHNDLKEVRFVARALKKIIEEYYLVPFIMTTGSKGYHIVVPIIAQHSFEKIHEFAKQIAIQVSLKYPDLCTSELSFSKRKNKIFIDYLRNSYGQTSVAPYSLRATKMASIATPLDWNELTKVTPTKYTIKNIFKRLSRKKDPWYTFFDKAKSINIKA